MALITDPDSLSQGQSNAVSDFVITTPGTSADSRFTSAGSNLPALAAGEFFEVRDHSDPLANGLWEVVTVNTSTSSYEVDKVSTGSIPATAGSEAATTLGATGAANEKSVHFDTATLEIFLIEQGNLSVDGVTMLALHSFAKEEWKSDAFLIGAAAFPMVGISFAAGQWVLGQDPSGNNSGWKFAEDNHGSHGINTRRLVRNAGWDEIDSAGNTSKKYFNVTTLGTFEDAANDKAYYRFGTDAADTGAAVDYYFAGPVNEPVKYFDEIGNPPTCTFVDGGGGEDTLTRATGDFAADGFQVGGQLTVRNALTAGNNGTYVLTGVAATTLTVATGSWTTGEADTQAQLAVDNSNTFTTFIRVRDADPNGKTFQQASLSDAGETAVTSKIIKFPLANATDLDISETDANIDANTPYTEIRLRYLSGTYNREVDTTTKRDFGIVVDVGTYSQSNGSVNATANRLDSANLNLGTGEALADYAGGTLYIHEGTDQGTWTISGTPSDNAGTLEITVTGDLTGSDTNVSFTMERATPLTATKNEIYEKVHRELRRDANINQATGGVVTGRTADDLATFVGPDLRFGAAIPTNPNGGGSGVIVEGFDTNDTNNLFFFDNTGTTRSFPFVAAGTLVFSQTLVDDTDGEYWLFYEYTARNTAADIDVVSPSVDTYDLEGTLGTYAVNDYLKISGFAQSANNGLFIVTVVNVSGSDYTVRKVDGTSVGTAETNQTVNVDVNPYPSPDAIVVDNNSGADILGNISTTSVSFDYDYENNVQGGRTADTDAKVVLVAAGLETGQVAVVKNLTITKTTGLTFSITSALERNYENV